MKVLRSMILILCLAGAAIAQSGMPILLGVQTSVGGCQWPSPTFATIANGAAICPVVVNGTVFLATAMNGGPFSIPSNGNNGGGVSSVFGRTNAVTAAPGDYTVSQVTGAAPLASPFFSGVPSSITPPLGTNSQQLATMQALQQALAALPASSLQVGTVITFTNVNETCPKGGTGNIVAGYTTKGCTVTATVSAITQPKQIKPLKSFPNKSLKSTAKHS